MKIKELEQGIELVIKDYEKEDWGILFEYLGQLGKKTNPKFNNTIFQKYIEKQIKMSL